MNRNHARSLLHVLSFSAVVIASLLEPRLATFALIAVVIMQALLVFVYRRPKKPAGDLTHGEAIHPR